MKPNHRTNMGKYLQWAPSLGEFTVGTKRGETLISCWKPFGSVWCARRRRISWLTQQHGASFLVLSAWILTSAHPHWDQFGVFTLSRKASLQEFDRISNSERERAKAPPTHYEMCTWSCLGLKWCLPFVCRNFRNMHNVSVISDRQTILKTHFRAQNMLVNSVVQCCLIECSQTKL